MPPSSTPSDPPPEATKPKTPIAFARSAGSVNSIIISDSATAETIGAADALHRSGDHEHLLRRRQAAQGRGDGEEPDPDQEQPPVAEQVAEPPAEQEEAAERDEVRVHDPRERLVGEAEVLADRRQRHADDRHVEDDHEVAEAEHEQCEPAFAVVHRHSEALDRLQP